MELEILQKEVNFFLSLNDAKQVLKKENISSWSQWLKYIKGKSFPKKIPKRPDKVYGRKKQWKGWADFLGKKSK